MALAYNNSLAFLATLLVLAIYQSNVLARPNFDQNTGQANVLHRSHKGKRTWDFPANPDSPDDPVLSLVEESELDNAEPTSEAMWLDIGRDFAETKQLTRNSDEELVCDAVGSPPPKIFWLKNGLPIESMTIVSNDESLNNRIEIGNNVIFDKFGRTGTANVKSKIPIRCAQPEDAGQYTCVAVNRGKQTSATTIVTVNDDSNAPRGSCEHRMSLFSYKKSKKGSSPVITFSETFHMEVKGNHVSLPCRAVGKPMPQLTWMDQGGKKVVSGKKYQVSASGNLVIRNLAWKDMGDYTCVVENLYGKDTIATFVYPLAEETSEER